MPGRRIQCHREDRLKRRSEVRRHEVLQQRQHDQCDRDRPRWPSTFASRDWCSLSCLPAS